MQKNRIIPDIIFGKNELVLSLTDGNGFLVRIDKFHTFRSPENGY